MLAIFGGGERFFQKVAALAGLKIQFKITNHRMDVLYIKVFCLPLQRQWFTAQVIKREPGENPGQSRCCKLSFRRRRRSHWSNIGKTGKASAPDNKVRRPALPKLHSGPEGWARSEIRVTYKPPPAPQKGESHAASDFSACLQEQAGIFWAAGTNRLCPSICGHSNKSSFIQGPSPTGSSSLGRSGEASIFFIVIFI